MNVKFPAFVKLCIKFFFLFWDLNGVLSGGDMRLCSEKKGGEEKDCSVVFR